MEITICAIWKYPEVPTPSFIVATVVPCKNLVCPNTVSIVALGITTEPVPLGVRLIFMSVSLPSAEIVGPYPVALLLNN